MKSPAWQRKEGKNPKGGLNAKGRASYKGGTLKAPVKAGDNPRRASFLARMGNAPGPERDKKLSQQDCYYLYRLGVLRLKRMHGLRLRQYPHETRTRKASNAKSRKKRICLHPKRYGNG